MALRAREHCRGDLAHPLLPLLKLGRGCRGWRGSLSLPSFLEAVLAATWSPLFLAGLLLVGKMLGTIHKVTRYHTQGTRYHPQSYLPLAMSQAGTCSSHQNCLPIMYMGSRVNLCPPGSLSSFVGWIWVEVLAP